MRVTGATKKEDARCRHRYSGNILAGADATEKTLQSILSVSIMPTKEKDADSQMLRSRPPVHVSDVVAVVRLTVQKGVVPWCGRQ